MRMPARNQNASDMSDMLVARKIRQAEATLKRAYRHVALGDRDIASGEMGDELATTLAELMGDKAFQEWLWSLDSTS